MMDVTMVCFSQTGNTRKVAEAMAEAFEGTGHTVRTLPLKNATPQDVVAGDLLGIGTPCFSSQAPTPVKDFLRTLPALERRRAFVFATSGGASGRVLYDLTRLLSDKGANVIGGFLARGELHHPAPCILGRYPNRPEEEDLARARRFAEAIVEHVAAGQPGPVAGSHPATFEPGGVFYDLVARASTDGFLRLAMPEPKLDATQCNQCGWCVQECPTDNIVLEPYPVLGDECIRCYRCLTGCPQEAFAADWRVGNLLVWSLYNPAFERWFGDVEPGERLY
ncbi:MAG: EFR1 family ferrodoxin [Anaerolineae bacterium]|jgi:flavodoxin/NAD-dependent dihydropyrimidine dehydrogenase PreA subunit